MQFYRQMWYGITTCRTYLRKQVYKLMMICVRMQMTSFVIRRMFFLTVAVPIHSHLHAHRFWQFRIFTLILSNDILTYESTLHLGMGNRVT
jgi:hypothetical protein